jgi:microcystin-dependent protein
MDYFIGEIRPFAFNFAPVDFMLCNGALLPISQFTALYSIIGTTYGGNGTNTFALPNIQGTVLVSAGQLAGGSNYALGEASGSPQVTLLTSEIPVHSHAFNGAWGGTIANEIANQTNKPDTTGKSYLGNLVGKSESGLNIIGFAYTPTAPGNVQLGLDTITSAGGGQPHNNMGPYLCINYCIAINGIFPARP